MTSTPQHHPAFEPLVRKVEMRTNQLIAAIVVGNLITAAIVGVAVLLLTA